MSRFVICRASAGSGKTYTLVRQYIEIAICVPKLIHSNYRHILAITFTNKAANGMKARIMDTLANIADKEKLIGEMAGHLGIDKDEVIERCRVLLSEILHHYSQFSVFTIDSFVHRIVQSFAHDLRLPMNFDVMLESDDIVKTTVDELLLMAGQDGNDKLTEVLCAFTEQNMQNDRSYQISSQIEALAMQIFREEAPQYLEKLHDVSLTDFMDIHKALQSAIHSFEASVTKAAKIAVDARISKGLEIKDFPYGKNGYISYFERFANGDFSKINEVPSRVSDVFDGKGGFASKNATQQIEDAIAEIVPELKRSYAELHNLLKNSLKEYNTWKLLDGNLFGLALLNTISEIKERYYYENGIVHISEFNKRISEQVMNEPTPFIYERIGGRYHNYLIDEFQDTSKLQWLNFVPLVDEAVGFDFGNVPLVGTQSLVVGDGKQAIYRFRQGDVRQFVALPKVGGTFHGKLLERYGHLDSLSINYRTLPHIVDFNNRFFEWAITKRFANNQLLQDLYINGGDGKHPALWQYPNPDKSGGYVEISFCSDDASDEDSDSFCQSILDTIRTQHEKGFRYGDIYVLARTNKILVEISNYIVRHQDNQPVPVVSNESFILSNSRSVLFLQALLSYIYDPRDRVAALRAVNMAIQTIKQSSNQTIRQSSNQAIIWQLRECHFNLDALFAAYGIDFHSRHYLSMSLYDCCESLIRLFHLGGNEDDGDASYIATFLNVVAKYSQRHLGNLGDFLDYLEKNISKISTSASSSDAVQLMTIHKAKGLEAPIVIYAVKKERPKASKMWVNVPVLSHNSNTQAIKQSSNQAITSLPVAFVSQTKDETVFKALFDDETLQCQMDEMNSFYVAMTRPESKLFVFCDDCPEKEGLDNISLLNDFVNKDDSGLDCKQSNNQAIRQSSNRTFCLGEDFTVPQPSSLSPQPSYINHLQTLDYPQWQSRIVISTPNAALLSTLGQLPSPDAGTQMSIFDVPADHTHHDRQFGILVHDLMSKIRSRDDVSAVVHGYCSANHLDGAIKDEIEHRILAMVDDPANAEYFNPAYRVACELSIVVGDKTCRPDRVVFAPDKTWVIDYKTGNFDPKSHESYQEQVAGYVSLISNMGHPNVKGVVLYL